jgi:hypothetical protein
MPQELVNFRATIIDATAFPVDDSVDYGLTAIDEMPEQIEETVEETIQEAIKAPACCAAKVQAPRKVEQHTNNSELADALPMILLGVGVAYLVGVYTGASIFSSTSYILDPLVES